MRISLTNTKGAGWEYDIIANKILQNWPYLIQAENYSCHEEALVNIFKMHFVIILNLICFNGS